MSQFAKRILKNSTYENLSSLKRADSTYTRTPEEALEELAAVRFPSHQHTPVKSYSRKKFSTAEILESNFWITDRKIKTCLLQFKSKQAAGPDGIKPIIVFSLMPEK